MKATKIALALLLLLALCFGAVGCNTDAKKSDELKLKLEDAKAAQTSEYEATVSSVEAEYAAALDELEAADEADKAALTTLKSEHSKALSEVEAEGDRIDGEITSLKAEYAEKITEAGGDPDSVLLAEPIFILTANGEGKSLDELIAEYLEKLEKLEDDKQKNKEKKEKLVKDYEEKLEKLEEKIEKNEEAIKKCKESFEKRLADIEEKHEAKLAELDSLIAELEEKTDKLAEKLEEIEGKLETAVPEVKTHTVSFDTNGGEGDFATVTVLHGEKAAKPTENPTRAGCEFLGWYYYDAEWSFLGYSVTEDMKLTAKWAPIDYTLTLKDYNEDGSDKVIGFDVESEALVVEAPERSGYEFLGWIEDGSTSLIDSLSLATGTVGNRTYTASWGVEVYTVTLKGCGSDGDDKILKYDINTEIASISAPKKRGYKFTGWTEENSSVVIDKLSISKGSVGNKTYLPHYEAEKYSITYVIPAAAEANPNPIEYTIESPTIQLQAIVFEYPGNTFLGWYSDSEYLDQVTEIPTGSAGNITLYAKAIIDDSQWWLDITYDTTELIMELNICSNNGELLSGLERYLAGDTADSKAIDELVAKRNDNAYSYTNVNVKYVSTPDDAIRYGYSRNIDRIYEEVSHRTKSTPDIYCNFISDMLCTSLNGSFANLYSTKHGTGAYYGDNYLNINEDGYMSDLMSSLTLNRDKIYVIASDYFIDLIRAFYVIPVNVSLYNSIADRAVNDYNNDGKKDINDLFYEVENKMWNYDRVAEYAFWTYKPSAGNNSGQEKLGDQLGFVLAQNGLPAAAMVYSSSVTFIERSYSYGEYEYEYPTVNYDLDALAKKLSWLFENPGVMCVTQSDAEEVGENTPILGVRKQFTSGKILFGGAVLLADLEYLSYQTMKNNGGFAIVPIPAYREGDDYLTQIHSLGRAGGISYSTAKFVQCSAFLHYQSTKSAEVLNEYFDYNFTSDVSDELDGNIGMLKLIRERAVYAFDKLFEDAIGFFYEDTQKGSEENRWHTYICENLYQADNLAYFYDDLVVQKQKNLQDLVRQYDVLPS